MTIMRPALKTTNEPGVNDPKIKIGLSRAPAAIVPRARSRAMFRSILEVGRSNDFEKINPS
jgi:hypothetical protein